MERTKRIAVCLLTMLALTAGAFGWNAAIHMAIARVAWEYMNPRARAEATRLLASNPAGEYADFGRSATWADDRRTPATAPWHYVNFHFRLDGQPVTNQPEPDNVLSAIDRFTKELRNKRLSDARRATALRYLIHLVGDVHQPLHCVALDSDEFPSGDKGGNLFKIREGALGFSPRNLHHLWDTGVGIAPVAGAEGEVESVASYVMGAVRAKTPAEAGDLTPADWAKESVAAAQNVAYTIQEHAAVSAAYMRIGQACAYERIELASLRLARLLDSILGK